MGRVFGSCCCLQAYERGAVLASGLQAVGTRHKCQAACGASKCSSNSCAGHHPAAALGMMGGFRYTNHSLASACPDRMSVAAAGVQDGDVCSEEQQRALGHHECHVGVEAAKLYRSRVVHKGSSVTQRAARLARLCTMVVSALATVDDFGVIQKTEGTMVFAPVYCPLERFL